MKALEEAEKKRLAKLDKLHDKRISDLLRKISTPQFFLGTDKPFVNAREPFHIVTYEKEDKNKKDELIRQYKTFYADSYKDALRKFGEIVLTEIMNRAEYKDADGGLEDGMEFGLIGNKKFLLSTSVFDSYLKKAYVEGGDESAYKWEHAGKEFATDKVAQAFIGWALHEKKIDWPAKAANLKEPEHFSFAVMNATTLKYTVTDCKANKTMCMDKYDKALLEESTFAMIAQGPNIINLFPAKKTKSE